MTLQFETLDEFSVASQVRDAAVTVKLRRQLNYKPSSFSTGPYRLDLTVGSISHHHYGIDGKAAREIAARFLLMHVDGIYPPVH